MYRWIVVACAAVLAACAGVDTALTVRIGHVAPTSGAIAHLGRDNEDGARLAIEDLNAQGLVIGSRKLRFELVAADDAADPRTAEAAARKLIEAKVSGVVGHLNSGPSIAAAPLYEAAGIPHISPSATNPRLTRLGHRTSFRLIGDDLAAGRVLAIYAVQQLGVRRVLVIDDRTAYGAGLADAFDRSIQREGAAVLAHDHVGRRGPDFGPALQHITESQPDLVFYGGMDAEAGPLIRQMAQAGVNASVMGGDGLCSAELVALSGGAASGGRVLCAEAGGVEPGRPAEALAAFNERFRKRFGRDVQIYAPYTYDAVMVLAQAMVRAGSSQPERYLPELARTREHAGVTGPITFDDKGDILRGAYTLYTYAGGRRTTVAVIR